MRLIATIVLMMVMMGLNSLAQENTYSPKFLTDGTILVVYDSTSPGCRVSLDSVKSYFNFYNVSYESYNRGNELVPTIRSFRGYKMIIWLGEGTSVMSGRQKDSLKAYLNNPQGEKPKLIIIAEDVGYTLGSNTSPILDLDFCNNYLGFNFLADRPPTGSNQALTWVHMPTITNHRDSTTGFWPDVMQLYNPFVGDDLIRYSNGMSNGIGKISTNFNTAVFGVDFQSLKPSYISPAGSAQRRLLYWAMMYVEYDGEIFSDATGKLTWQSTLNIKNASNTGGNLDFGMAPTATNNIDIALGESPLGAVPPASTFDARFELPTTSSVYSLKDYRDNTLGEVIWKLNFQPGGGGYPITFSWTAWVLPVGEFRLRNNAAGTIVNVDMKSDSIYVLNNTGVTSLEIYYQKELCGNINLNAGWNIVSVPVNAVDMSKTTLFPDATSPLYGFSNGYVNTDTARSGKGYWVRYGSSTVKNICGTQVEPNTVAVKSGWNLIGIYTSSAVVSNLTTTPANIITSPFYQYNNGYQSATMLETGKGFWVRVNSDGFINLNNMFLEKGRNENLIVQDFSTFREITVRDGNHNVGYLYAANKDQSLSVYDLPPLPPEGVFDIRFASQRSVELLRGKFQEIKIYSALYPVEFTANKKMRFKIETGNEREEKELNEGEKLMISEGSRIFVSEEEMPVEYRLTQNFPNPFNPSTKINYQIPEGGRVTMKVYDVLGVEIATLVNREQDAGYYEIEFNAATIPSGVYFYELQIGDFREIKKMMVIR